MSKKQNLLDEKKRLEKELMELGSVAETQVWHKKARIQQIDEEVRKLETNQFDKGNDRLKSMMEQQNKHGLTPEQMAMINATKKEF